MQILQWLLKVSQEQAIETTPSSKRMLTLGEEKEKEKDCDEFESDEVELECKDLFSISLTRANSRTRFYSTLNLRSLKNFCERRDCLHPLKKEHMSHKVESANVGNKVLPICDATVSVSGTDYSSDGSVNKKRRALSRMKELIRWAATAKSDKGGNKGWKVLYFRNKGNLKAPPDEISSSSSKISFRWDVGSCSAYSSALSPLSLASSTTSHRTFTNQNLEIDSKETCVSPKDEECVRMGNWITTDSEFVVLEL
ncbi:uncharacterized protein LOC143862660 [Tasmannia lanceolata]|uniref:uncharacterized protein LOC143862660 n=1 Tax=Tasmannia lanceolata TaxID=3420 RepID=UPI004063A1D7